MHKPIVLISIAIVFVLVLLLCLRAVGAPRSVVKDRLDVIEDKAACQTAASTLLVFLPGIRDTPEDIVRKGFITALRERRLAVDVVVADANFGYYAQGLIVQRLHDDIIAPARKKGYRQIWLAGISLGGYGALHFAREHGDMVQGLILIAPYLGGQDLLDEIGKAGGVAGWQTPPADSADATNTSRHDRRLWSWLKTFTRSAAPANRQPAMYLGYGKSDKFAAADQMLAATLPAARVIVTEGGHTWQPWQQIWAHFLDHRLLPGCEQDHAAVIDSVGKPVPN